MSGTVIGRRPPRTPRSALRITCSELENGDQIFTSSALAVDVDTTTKKKKTQDTPSSGGVVEGTEATLEIEGNLFQHEPSELLALSGDCSNALYEANSDQDHCSLSCRDDAIVGYISITHEPASCPPQEEILQLSNNNTRHDASTKNVLTSCQEQGTVWDSTNDNEVLKYFYHNPSNLVLDSALPYHAPHIVITQVEESWEDQYIAWSNRADVQWQGSLPVPELDLSEHLPFNTSQSQHFPSLTTSLDGTPSYPVSPAPIPVFNYAKIERPVDSTAERSIVTQLVSTLQKAQCKAVFFAASDFACLFRKRYDVRPSLLSKIDPVFMWSDPAEPILIASFGLLGTTILDSTCPFTLPHIIINAPPPQSPQLTENNATPYIQDAAFGQRLTVRSYLIEIANSAEDWDYFSELSFPYSEMSYDEIFVDQMESESESRPGTPAPETPNDEEGNGCFFYIRDGEDISDGPGIHAGVEHSNMYPFDSLVQVGVGMQPQKFQVTSRPLFFIDEDEDDLPSLDDWYR